LIGSYGRNYGTHFSTFHPFTKNGKDYALYSPDYTATRIMELPSCKDLGGEEPGSYGFCPVDYYVPSYIDREWVDSDDKKHLHRIHDPKPEDLCTTTNKFSPLDEKTGQRITVEKPAYPIGPLSYCPFGFVAGCVWGDDSSWKIQFLDLAEAHRGIIKREERFGYIVMPASLSLRQAVRLTDDTCDGPIETAQHLTIAVEREFDLRTGKQIDADPFV
jgi:hypothetical protein